MSSSVSPYSSTLTTPCNSVPNSRAESPVESGVLHRSSLVIHHAVEPHPDPTEAAHDALVAMIRAGQARRAAILRDNPLPQFQGAVAGLPVMPIELPEAGSGDEADIDADALDRTDSDNEVEALQIAPAPSRGSPITADSDNERKVPEAEAVPRAAPRIEILPARPATAPPTIIRRWNE